MVKRALISVSDKTGVVELAQRLEALGYEIISTGGTYKALEKAGIKVIAVDTITGFPECLDGRVKTLHPSVHAGILAMRSNPNHMAQLEKLNINTIDIVVVNLYPFKATIMKEGIELQTAIENIDIGGPTMLRSAAKNYQDVCVLVDANDYGKVLDELENGGVSLETKFYLMYKVFQHTAVYDTLISTYMRNKLGIKFPEQITFAYEKAQDLRYGENPHQDGVFYKECLPVKGSLAFAEQLHGKELSYNNINDTNGALDLLREFDEPTVVAVKHANPCGVGTSENISDAYKLAYDADPVSIFGGILAINRTVDLATANEISKIFIEVVVAPDFDADALAVLSKKQNIRLLKLPTINSPLPENGFEMKKVVGGLLMQDFNRDLYDNVTVVSKRAPTEKELNDMRFAMKVVKHTKSNAIVIAKDNSTVGIGSGQTNRIWATNQAIEHGGARVVGSVMASDAFFPFDDCVEAAAKAGVTAIVHPGGSKQDELSFKKADEYGIAMIITGKRHFKH
ncbi:MAG: bifunctional phosphoribosylaminoimidazolecarboxamide formyltransferase/IMP cyclohydrolase [Clostridia bacterium]